MIRVALPFGRTPEGKRGAYRQALQAAGIQPVEDASRLDGLEGLLLAGGSDIDPALYGESRQIETGEADGLRDQLEMALLGEALERDLPVLAICRGLQLLNVALGGSLMQHIDGHKCPGRQEAHSIAIEPESRLQSILGVDHYVVNSRHHQCAYRIGHGLTVAARDPEGVIEALELPGKAFVVAVQWHPEERAADAALFEAFRIAAARTRSDSRAS